MDTDCDHISGCGTASGGTSTITLCFGLKISIKKMESKSCYMLCNCMLWYVMVFFDDWENNDIL